MRIGLLLAAVGIVASLGCGQAAAQRGAGARRFTLSGTVVDGSSSRPLAGVALNLQTEKWVAVGDTLLSDGQGRFAFRGLPAGEYILTAEGPFGTIQFGEATDPGWVSSIRVGGESGDKSVVFRIVPRGSIEGVVRDEFSDPMMHATVLVTRSTWRSGKTTMSNVAQKPTDDKGRYRVGNLAPGTYTVCASGDQNAVAPSAGPVDFAARVDNRTYSRTCGRPFQLAPGQHTQVDLNPAVISTATVRGHVRNVPAQTGFSVNLIPVEEEGVGQNLNAFVDAGQGTFTFRRVPPGRYRLWTNLYTQAGGAGALTADIPVDVGGSDIDGLEVALGSGAALDIAVHGETGISLRSTNGPQAMMMRGPTHDKDGGMHFEALSPGSYWVDTYTKEGMCVESIKQGNREVRGQPVELAAGTAVHLEVWVSNRCGSVTTRALRGNDAVPGAKVVLLLGGTAREPGTIREDFTDDEGEFTFSDLAPGRYLLWAWAVSGEGAMTGPSSLAAVEQQATVVEVTAGNTVRADVPLLTGGGQ